MSRDGTCSASDIAMLIIQQRQEGFDEGVESIRARYEALEKAAWDVISELSQATQDYVISTGFARKIENTLGKALADCSADDGRISLERED